MRKLKRNPTNGLKPQINFKFERGLLLGFIPATIVVQNTYSPSEEDFMDAATKRVNHEIFKDNIRNLTVSLYQYTSDALTTEEKEEVETRLVNQWINIAEYHPTIISDVMVPFISTLRNQQLIPRKQAKTLIDILKRTEKPIKRTITTEIPQIRKELKKPKEEINQTEDCREYMMNALGLDKKIADYYASQVQLETIHHIQHELKTTFGDIYTEIIAENPEILQYMLDSKFTKYITTVQLVQRAVKNQNRTDLNLEENIATYAHLEHLLELKRKLYGRELTTEEEIKTDDLDISNVSLVSYRFLHKNVDSVRGRLDSLIENGSVSVSDHEHWNIGKSKSARGRDILIEISRSMRQLFKELDLPEPWYDLNFGQSTLTINEEGADYLRQIRDLAYERQK